MSEEIEIDLHGRYELAKGRLKGMHIVLGSIYAPNTDQGTFWHTLSGLLSH